MRSLFLAVLAALALPAAAPAQTPARFPALPEAQIESLLNGAYCAASVSTIARTVARTEGWRGFAMLLCNPDYSRAGVFVAWVEQGGQRRIIPARADGQPFHVPEGGPVNDGDQQSQVSLFALRGPDRQLLGCQIHLSNRLREPWASTFCDHLDAQGNVIRRR